MMSVIVGVGVMVFDIAVVILYIGLAKRSEKHEEGWKG